MSIRDYRVGSLAIADWVATLIAAIIISFFVRDKKLEPSDIFYRFLILTFIAILTHVLFGINTQLNYLMGISGPPKK